MAWFPSIVRLVVAYQLSSRGRITGRGVVAFGLAAGGVMAVLDGFMLGVTEESRARYGRVSSGVVVEKFSSSGAQGTRRIGRRGGRDFVTEEQWLPLRAGSTVNVRQADSETTTSRIDGHPRWTTAFADLGIGGLLLSAAGLVSGRLGRRIPSPFSTETP